MQCSHGHMLHSSPQTNVLMVTCSTPPHRLMKPSFSITSQKPPNPWDKQSHSDWKHNTWSVRGTHIPGFSWEREQDNTPTHTNTLTKIQHPSLENFYSNINTLAHSPCSLPYFCPLWSTNLQEALHTLTTSSLTCIHTPCVLAMRDAHN